jgi:pyrroloquinoline quinone biosynthesis protein B
MLVRVLGSAAGGGFPQWNCSCHNCSRLRSGSFAGTARSQTQLAISADASAWFLVNASPDLRYQIEAFAPLHPATSSLRHSPIHGILLTSAELDASLGLLLLRESQPTAVYATSGVKKLLTEDNAIFGVLRRQNDQVQWHAVIPGRSFPLISMQGEATGISCTPISTGGAFPSFVTAERAAQLDEADAVLGLFLEHDGKQIAFFPGAAHISPEWLARMEECDAVFLDGTFWSDDELIRIQGSGKTARQMGHLHVGGPGGTLELFAALKRPRKILIHINNTNPILDESSPEHQRMLAQSWELAFDGMELEV